MKKKCIALLQEIKHEIARIKNEIVAESSYIESLLKKLSQHKGISFDSQKHAAIKQGIAQYVASLGEIEKMVDHNIAQCNEANAQAIQRFCKKMKKDLSVSYSRFCFGFETQKRQLEYLQKMLTQ